MTLTVNVTVPVAETLLGLAVRAMNEIVPLAVEEEPCSVAIVALAAARSAVSWAFWSVSAVTEA